MLRLCAKSALAASRNLAVAHQPARLLPPSSTSLLRSAVAKLSLTSMHTSARCNDMATGAEDVETTRKITRKPRATKTTAAKGGKKAPAKAKKATKKAAKPKAPPRPKKVLQPPKRISTPWILFYKDKLDSLDASERKSVTDLTKRYADEYRALSAEEKQRLADRVEEHKAQWEKDMAEYMKTVTPEMISAENAYRRDAAKRRVNKSKKSTKLKPLRDPTKPTLPLNGYMRFCQRMRDDKSQQEQHRDTIQGDLSSMPVAEQGKALAAVWRSLSDVEKQEYHSQYEQAKIGYEEELRQWREKTGVTN